MPNNNKYLLHNFAIFVDVRIRMWHRARANVCRSYRYYMVRHLDIKWFAWLTKWLLFHWQVIFSIGFYAQRLGMSAYKCLRLLRIYVGHSQQAHQPTRSLCSPFRFSCSDLWCVQLWADFFLFSWVFILWNLCVWIVRRMIQNHKLRFSATTKNKYFSIRTVFWPANAPGTGEWFRWAKP